MLRTKNTRRYSLIFLLVFSLVFSPLNFQYIIRTPSASADDIIIDSDTEWSGLQTISGYAIVENGVTLTIKKGAIIEFEGQSSFDIQGTLRVEGTTSDPVVFRKKNTANVDDRYAIATSGSIYARNIDVSGGGSASEVFMVQKSKKDSFFQHANAMWLYSGAFTSYDTGKLDIEGANFHDNALAIYTAQNSSSGTKIWRSKFSQNKIDVVNAIYSGSLNAEYNWWEDANGPVACTIDCGEYHQRPYQKIIGTIDFSHFAKEKDFRDPVIVIPGIMGSWKMTQKSDLELDPISDTYENLLETLRNNGYTENKNLFPFPYEWHYSNVESAKLLKKKIDEIKTQTDWPRVDIVAHSMGGLVAREYIETLNGRWNIDQLITLGTPHNGSPESYLAWVGGKFTGFQGFLANKIFKQEAEENGYSTVFDYIRNAPIPSVRELLPVYNYLRDQSSGALRTYPALYPKNTFLENLKNVYRLLSLDPIDFTNIVGKTNRDDTISTIRVDGSSIELLNDPEKIVLWGHGKPDGYDSIFGDRGLELGSGDGTVPLESATNILADETIELASSHGNLPTDAANIIVEKLTGMNAVPYNPTLLPIHSYLLVMPFSPIDIQIIAPDGSRVGKNFETGKTYSEIPDAYYTGYDTKNEFITIPNPIDGEYTVLTQGTDTGTYRVEVSKITEIGASGGEAKESTVSLTGVATPDAREEKKIELQSDDTVVAVNQDTIPPITTLTSTGTQGTNDWYTSDVAVTLSALDDQDGSGVSKTEYSLDNGTSWTLYTAPLTFSDEGTTTVQYFSTDKSGNTEAIQTKMIKRDKTAPDAKIVFNRDTQKLEVIGIDTLGESVSVVNTESVIQSEIKPISKEAHWYDRFDWNQKNKREKEDNEKKVITTTLTDQAGHTTVIVSEEKENEKNHLRRTLRSLSYDGISVEMKDVEMRYEWQKNWRGRYAKMDAQFKTPEMSIESKYLQKRNETQITKETRGSDDEDEENSEKQKTKEKFTGMIIPSMTTENGEIIIKY